MLNHEKHILLEDSFNIYKFYIENQNTTYNNDEILYIYKFKNENPGVSLSNEEIIQTQELLEKRYDYTKRIKKKEINNNIFQKSKKQLKLLLGKSCKSGKSNKIMISDSGDEVESKMEL